jgi:sigma-E factor negative regulatory protein RseC
MSEVIHQSVLVKKTQGQYAWILSTDDSACASCASKNSCSSTNLLKPLLDATLKNEGLRVLNSLNAKAGDRVDVELSASSLLKATVLAYLFPLFSLFILAWLGKLFFGELASIIMGLAGLFIGLYLVKIYLSGSWLKTAIEPHMVKPGQTTIHPADSTR